MSLAAMTLLVLGAIITVLGLLAAGSLLYTALGLASIAVAGLLELAGRRQTIEVNTDMDEQGRES